MVFALEGHSFSGKTVLHGNVVANYDVAAVAEHDVIAGGIENFPDFPFATDELAADNVDFFTRLEADRSAIALAEQDRPALYDRSYLSVVLFQKFLASMPDTHSSAYHHARSRYQETADRVGVTPDFLLHVTCDDETYKRRQGRDISVDVLRGDTARDFFESEYAKLREVYGKLGRGVLLVSEDTPDNLADNTERVGQTLEVDAPSRIDKDRLIARILEVL